MIKSLHTLFILGLFFSSASTIFSQENNAILCADGIDNNGNFLIDCLEPQCISIFNGNPINGCDTCGGGLSFGDSLIAYEPGCIPGDPEPRGALGLNDHLGAVGESDEAVFLGSGGSIEIGFTNNLLVNSGTPETDLWIFEAGPVNESTSIALRPNDAFTISVFAASGLSASAGGYYNIGGIGGAASSIDIDTSFPGYASGELKFDAVRITDASEGLEPCGSDSPGADIDAICAVFSIPPEDCNGTPNGLAALDECGVCDDNPANDNACLDCAGVANGSSLEDMCGVCDDNPANDNATCVDCAGVMGGSASLDLCGICDDNPANDNECMDCNGVMNGTATEDDCGVCDEDSSNDNLCHDCAGIANGLAYEDGCGVCDDIAANDNSTCTNTKSCDLQIPTAFSPNNDGVNDSIKVLWEGDPNENAPATLDFKVFDRWGSLVYEKLKFKQSNELELWRGKTNDNKDAPKGIYFFSYTCEDENQETSSFTGNITLLR